MKVLLLIVLVIAAVDDLFSRSIHMIYIAAFFAGAVCIQILEPQNGYGSMVLGILLGVAVYVISYLGGGAFGSGDAYVLAMCGAYLGISSSIQLFVRAIMMTGLYGIFVIVKNFFFLEKTSLKERIPFVPFILTAYLSMLWRNG